MQKSCCQFKFHHQHHIKNQQWTNSRTSKKYFKDIEDHISHIKESFENHRDHNSQLKDLYQSNVSNKMNTIMKTLTIISTIFIPITFLAGMYGTNFINLPEAKWKYGYYMLWLICLILAILMLFIFKKKKWF